MAFEDLNYSVNKMMVSYKEDVFKRRIIGQGCKILKVLILLMIVVVTIMAATAAHAGKIKVFVSILPQKYFVLQIGKELVDVEVMVQPGASPATYEPKPAQMVALSKARIYYAIGVPFEKAWLKKITTANPTMIIVHTERGIEKRPMKARNHNENERLGHKEKHDHGIKDPHVWTSPPHVMVQARNILIPLLEIDQAHQSIYEANYKKFIMELLDLDRELRGIFTEKGRGMEFMVFHPSWGYFADSYGLVQVPIEIEGKDPKPSQLQYVIRYARERGITVIFVQPQFSTKSAEIIAKAIGGQVVFANPLAENWMESLRQQAKKFKAALR